LTNKIALILGAIIVALIVADIVFADSWNLLFLGKKFANLIEWMAFWR